MHVSVMARWLFGLGGITIASFVVAFHGCSSPNSTAVTGGGGGAGAPPAEGGGLAAGGTGSGGGGGLIDSASDVDVPGASWTPVPGSDFTGPNCRFYQAAPASLSFAPLQWTTCGTGCESADPTTGYAVPSASAIAASTTKGVAYLQYAIVLEPPPTLKLLARIIALPEGVPVAALLEDSHSTAPTAPCVLSQYARSARFIEISGTAPPQLSVFGFAPTNADSPWFWTQPQPIDQQPASKDSFVTDKDYFFTGAGGVFALLDPQTNSAWTTIESPSESKFGGGDGDLAVWTEWNTNRIRGWAPDGKGVRTLLESAPPTTWLVQPSATRIVGLVVDADYEASLSTSVRLWYMPRTYETATGPTLTPTLATDVVVPSSGLRTWGDFAGVVARDSPPDAAPSSKSWLLVVKLSTGKAWRVEAEAGYVIQQASWTFDDKWLFFGETLQGAANVNKLHRIRRVQLAELDVWGTPLG